jgi:cardiolipin synthase
MKERTKKRLEWVLIVSPIIIIVFSIYTASQKRIQRQIQPLYGVSDPQFVRTMGTLLGPTILPGHRTTTLLNGDQVFPSMLEAIRNAKKTITFETYIYWSGKVGKMFTEALSERARAGVKTHLMIDWVGSSKIDKKLIKEMQNAGVEVVRYNPLHWYSLDRVNNRTHRKILVCDGKVGFTGGLGVADHWLGNARNKEEWRDTHFRFEGPAVGQMQAAFMDNWLETTGTLLHGKDYFPELREVGPENAQVFMSNAEDSTESAYMMYMLSIACAQKEILLSNAYFVPDDFSLKTLEAAAKRGVKIRIIAPGEVTDTKIVRSASRSRWGELLQAGVEFYEYQPTMYHCKVMVIDGLWVSVGSTNFDNRSFKLDDEVNLNVYDHQFADQQIKIFQQDLAKSKRITYAEWKNRSWFEKLKDNLAGLLRAQL